MRCSKISVSKYITQPGTVVVSGPAAICNDSQSKKVRLAISANFGLQELQLKSDVDPR